MLSVSKDNKIYVVYELKVINTIFIIIFISLAYMHHFFLTWISLYVIKNNLS